MSFSWLQGLENKKKGKKKSVLLVVVRMSSLLSVTKCVHGSKEI